MLTRIVVEREVSALFLREKKGKGGARKEKKNRSLPGGVDMANYRVNARKDGKKKRFLQGGSGKITKGTPPQSLEFQTFMRFPSWGGKKK